jgi:hypothetical protein
MHGFPFRQPRSRLAAVVVTLIFVCSPLFAQRGQQAGPFDGLVGNWSGAGTITLSSGANERIQCRATYVVGSRGAELQQTLRCASDSYTLDLRSAVVYENGALRGTWSDTTRNTSGTVSGRADAGLVQASVVGPSFSAALTVSTRGDRQNVSITSQGSPLTRATVALQRRGG